MRSSSTAATSKALSASELKNCADMMVEKPFFIVSRASRRRVGACRLLPSLRSRAGGL
jgi:hypothetical protein